ncbi:undecaprenyl-diphosphatase [Lamprobacter modestohalophilus]|uniref:Undecaprenyl-diphosphatase n=1 Tax=Lamprobacter modestohalophilus TaxID=1064514 RepID=A0A9X1B486_9GAMM|nr:undecaprenyl-diphosphate phosphatase [Lamprobacter modestohalophilus]MBK1619168.1 undecaprenyl-diphosphatase [Lamprobacter modestohalophilus]
MDVVQIVLLAAVQGLTEFLPISSSAHLIVTPIVFGYELQSLAFDVAVHLGTLAAVMLYFRHELATMTLAVGGAIRTGSLADRNAHLGWMILIATLPILVLGFPLKTLLEVIREDEHLVQVVIASTTIGFGLLLWQADRLGKRRRDEYKLGWRSALLIGLFQAIAIIPGTSRSGITMTAGLFLGLTREAASRFSFLLSIPTILIAGLLETKELIESPDPVAWGQLWLGAALSFAIAYLTIHFFLRFIERISMFPFVAYRLILGLLIFWVVLL